VLPKTPMRPATVRDVPALARLMLELGYETGAPELQRRVELLTAHSDHYLRVAVDEDDQVLGGVHASLQFELTVGAFVEIEALIVSRDSRRHGVGLELVRAVEGWAAQRGIYSVRVRSQIHRDGAAAFYRRLGYTAIKQQTVFVRETSELRPTGPVTLQD
jgi:GNAT superfamily N-acetyltransferase